MDTQRLILVLIFGFSLVMLWEGWQKQHQPTPAPTRGQTAQISPTPAPAGPLSATPSGVPAAPAQQVVAAVPKAVVKTDLFVAEISAQGGDLVRLELTRHKATTDESRNFLLFENDAQHVYLVQSGLIGDSLPNHKTQYSFTPGTYELKSGADTLQLRLEAPESNGVKVAKVFTFHRGSYVVDVSYEITNQGSVPVTPNAYFQLVRDGKPPEGTTSRMGARTFTGPAVYTEEGKFQKVDFEHIDENKAKFVHKAKDGWIAMVQHYFVSAWLPPTSVEREYFVRKLGDNLYAAGVILPVATVAPGQTARVQNELYAGPQEQEKLSKIAPGFDLVVDYGWLTVIAAPLFWVLQMLHRLVGNWGWAIILLTVIIKLIFFPLSAASYRSMAKMRLVTPKLMKLKEQYANGDMPANKKATRNAGVRIDTFFLP